ncbi:MAG: transporter related protein, partial [Actinomycetia bacterium]|nr:transporter related protein [Actinomycetes bacterium]
MAGELLRLDGVGVLRDGATLLRNVHWTVIEYERSVIMGTNGAGKTTLLHVAATMLHPSEGAVEVLDERLGQTDVFDLRPRIGFA